MTPPAVEERDRVEVGRKYRFEMRTGMDRWGTVRQVLPDAYVVTLVEPLVVGNAVLQPGAECLVDRRLVTEVEEVC